MLYLKTELRMEQEPKEIEMFSSCYPDDDSETELKHCTAMQEKCCRLNKHLFQNHLSG